MFLQVYLTHRYLALVLEYAPGGDLFKYVDARGRQDEATARRIFQQVRLLSFWKLPLSSTEAECLLGVGLTLQRHEPADICL